MRKMGADSLADLVRMPEKFKTRPGRAFYQSRIDLPSHRWYHPDMGDVILSRIRAGWTQDN
jgi:hypothetical protein